MLGEEIANIVFQEWKIMHAVPVEMPRINIALNTLLYRIDSYIRNNEIPLTHVSSTHSSGGSHDYRQNVWQNASLD